MEQVLETRDDVVFDADSTASRFDDDEVLRYILGVFLDTLPQQWAVVRRSAAKASMSELASGAHTLAGSLGVIDAPQAYRRVRLVERAATDGDVACARSLVTELGADLKRLWSVVVPLVPGRLRPHRRSRAKEPSCPHSTQG